MLFDMRKRLLVDVPKHLIVVFWEFGWFGWVTGIWWGMVVGSLAIPGMLVPPTFPSSVVAPVLLIMQFEITTRVPAKIVVRVLDIQWKIVSDECRRERRFPVFQRDGSSVNVGRGIKALFDTHENCSVNTPDGKMRVVRTHR